MSATIVRSAADDMTLFDVPEPHWFGCSCKPVWLAVVSYGIREWATARGWSA